MKKSVASFGKKALACACSVALGAALVPAAALAAGDGTGTGGGNGGGGGGSSTSYVLQVQLQDDKTGKTISLKNKKYTQESLQSLASVNTDRVSIMYGKSDGTVISTTNYVTIEQLVGDLEKWTTGSSLIVSNMANPSEDGAYNTTLEYEAVTADQYFYPNYAAKDASAEGAVAVSPVISISGNSATIGTGTADDALQTIIKGEGAEDDSMRFLIGQTELSTLTPGKPLVKGVQSLTVVYPHKAFEIVAKNATTEESTVVTSYTDEQLAALATNTESASYLLGNNVYVADKYVKVSDLLTDSKIWKTGSSATISAPDGFSTTVSYEQMTADQYFYPNYSASEVTDFGAVKVVPVVAIEGRSAKLGTSTAGDVAADDEALSSDEGNMPRFFRGNTDHKELLRGNSSPSMIDTITITYTPAEPDTPNADSVKPDNNKAKAKAKAITVNAKTVTAKSLAAAAKKAGTDTKTVTSITLGSKVKTVNASAFKSFKKLTKVTLGKNVKTIKKNAFKGSKVKTVVLKTKKLTKKSVKSSLKSSKVKTVKVAVGSKKTNKKYVKSYKKIFTKANAGKKVSVKA